MKISLNRNLINIYNNVYALFSYCLCFVIYVLQQVYKSVS